MSKNEKNYVYMLVTADKYELPLMVADTMAELTEMSGYCYTTLRSAMLRNSVLDDKYKVVKVDIREPIEKCTKSEYEEFCKEKKLKVNEFESFKSFMIFCLNY